MLFKRKYRYICKVVKGNTFLFSLTNQVLVIFNKTNFDRNLIRHFKMYTPDITLHPFTNMYMYLCVCINGNYSHTIRPISTRLLIRGLYLLERYVYMHICMYITSKIYGRWGRNMLLALRVIGRFIVFLCKVNCDKHLMISYLCWGEFLQVFES